ncbi:DUF2461 domain-containing protein [Flagellimonas meridianipacifica]|uniref:Uncharacterized protein (TIGR02453 family) n=1 Tax=Flagellimonas meridianipacifica TaxID=1080225 RepID=A0A2T0MHD5_9FLAO|nr:DUF2461 domain-containing protein [Allomuricauda pacifica]PRX56972.1 uncharacterized protein (TIGR02453 family) [Allomuricauda pacifica]
MITEAYSSFFKELAQNNHKEWFHANKKRYEKDVKTPFLNLLDAVLPTLKDWESKIDEDSKKALFRINRDIRFSKDKSPYNTIMKAGFSPGGKKSELPGFYLGIDAENIHVGGGLFMISTPELKHLRYHIAENAEALLSIVEQTDFVQNFGKLKGEKAKRLDKELMPVSKKTDLIFNKQFYAMAEFPLAPFYDSESLVDEVLNHFEAIRPLNTYLNKALA